MLKKSSQKGFTIVELLIVIVIIGILAALVLNTFADSQKRARDTQRTTDISALATQLEVYYNDHGAYPQYSQIDTLAEAKAAFPGISEDALDAPSNAANFDLTAAQSTGVSEYGYVALNGAAACAADDACTTFTLSWTKEAPKPTEAALQTKKSLN